MIKFESLTKAYPDGTVAVDDLTLEIPTGKITVFVGPSGCGKTTSLRMINRLIEPTSGRILIDGKDVRELGLVELRLGIGYVIQQAGLFPHRTVLDNIATVPHLLGWSKKKARARAYELLERVGLPESFAKRFPAQLSGGQQQRVGVARALAADPPIMLMDEPFSAVDPVVRAGLQDEFLRLQQQLGKTIVFVSHDIDEAIKLGDYVAVFRAGGHFAQFAPPRELLENPADAFVAEFIGRDRGIRSLSFVPVGELSLGALPTVTSDASEKEAAGVAGRFGSQWVLVLDADGRPGGWANLTGRTGHTIQRPAPVGTTFTTSSSVRAALDAALLSPAGMGVCVDEDGRVLGGAAHEQIARHLDDRRTSAEATR